MRILIISNETPGKNLSGSGNYLHEVITVFLKKKIKLSYFLNTSYLSKSKVNKFIRPYKKKVNFYFVNQTNKTSNFLDKFYGGKKEEIEKYIQRTIIIEKPDVLFLYGSASIFWCENITNVKKFCFATEMPFEISKLRLKYQSNNFLKLLKNILYLIRGQLIQRKIANILKSVTLIGHSSEDFRKILINKYNLKVKYYRHPNIFDKIDYNGLIKLRKKKIRKKFSILMVGKMSSINYAQYKYLNDELIFYFKKYLDIKNVRLNIVGANQNANFKNLYENNFVINKGFVNNIRKEYLSNDIILSASPISAGLRSRLHEAFNLGCVVICTKSDAYSDPTLKNNYNCLVSKNSKDIVNNINYLMNNKKKYYEIQKKAFYTVKNELNTSKIVQEYLKDIKKK